MLSDFSRSGRFWLSLYHVDSVRWSRCTSISLSVYSGAFLAFSWGTLLLFMWLALLHQPPFTLPFTYNSHFPSMPISRIVSRSVFLIRLQKAIETCNFVLMKGNKGRKSNVMTFTTKIKSNVETFTWSTCSN
jgi:hypothetical protein